MRQRLLFLLLLLFFSVSLSPPPSEAAGPWKAQVIDAETDKPLEGVVVLAAWYKAYASVGGWAGGEYYDSEEVVTGPDGRFGIQSRWTFTLNPFSTIKGPDFYIFKSGYGRWRFQGDLSSLKLDLREQEARGRKLWEQFEGEGVVIELPRLKTREERLQFLREAPSPLRVPPSRMPKYRDAINQEAVSLGLQSYRKEP